MEKITEQLMGVGLTEKEARAYLALLEIGKGTAYAIAKQSGLKRPTVYLVLEDLRRKGLVNKIPHVKNQVYLPKDPREFFDELEGKLYGARKTLPSLLTKYSKGNVVTHLFDGKDDMEKAVAYRRDELANGELLAFYGVPRNGKRVPQLYYDHAQHLQTQGTKVRVLAPDDAALKEFRAKEKEFGQESIYLPRNKYLPRVSVEVGKDFSKIFLHSAHQALVIEGEEFSEFMRQVFELLWGANHGTSN